MPEPAAGWGLGERLKAVGLGPALLGKLARVGDRLDDALRAPMRVWAARRMREPGAVAARLFLLHDPVTVAEATEGAGDPRRAAGGRAARGGDGGRGSRRACTGRWPGTCTAWGTFRGLAGEAVMPICGATMELVRAAKPTAPVESALDLGCGAAPVGLLLARACRRVVATDVNARALAFASVNAALNGVRNLELRLGDLYETVRGERFDRIAAHPPFVARPAGARASTFVHGGDRGGRAVAAGARRGGAST